jgi:hypothetical protein
MQKYKYFIGGLEDMGAHIIRLSDGTEISLDKATPQQVGQAVSIRKVADAPIENA